MTTYKTQSEWLVNRFIIRWVVSCWIYYFYVYYYVNLFALVSRLQELTVKSTVDWCYYTMICQCLGTFLPLERWKQNANLNLNLRFGRNYYEESLLNKFRFTGATKYLTGCFGCNLTCMNILIYEYDIAEAFSKAVHDTLVMTLTENLEIWQPFFSLTWRLVLGTSFRRASLHDF